MVAKGGAPMKSEREIVDGISVCVNCHKPIYHAANIWFHALTNLRWCTALKWWERLIKRIRFAAPQEIHNV